MFATSLTCLNDLHIEKACRDEVKAHLSLINSHYFHIFMTNNVVPVLYD